MKNKNLQQQLQKNIQELQQLKRFYSWVLFFLTIIAISTSIASLLLICFP